MKGIGGAEPLGTRTRPDTAPLAGRAGSSSKLVKYSGTDAC